MSKLWAMNEPKKLTRVESAKKIVKMKEGSSFTVKTSAERVACLQAAEVLAAVGFLKFKITSKKTERGFKILCSDPNVT